MTPEQRQVRFQDRIRELEVQLHIADYGMGMPRDYQRVQELKRLLEEARKAAEIDNKCPHCGSNLTEDYRHICKDKS